MVPPFGIYGLRSRMGLGTWGDVWYKLPGTTTRKALRVTAPKGYRFTFCRAIAHGWKLNPGSANAMFLGRSSDAVLPFICTECGTERIDALSRFSGALISRRYIHPEGYEMDYSETEPGDRVTRDDWRRALVDAVEHGQYGGTRSGKADKGPRKPAGARNGASRTGRRTATA